MIINDNIKILDDFKVTGEVTIMKMNPVTKLYELVTTQKNLVTPIAREIILRKFFCLRTDSPGDFYEHGGHRTTFPDRTVSNNQLYSFGIGGGGSLKSFSVKVVGGERFKNLSGMIPFIDTNHDDELESELNLKETQKYFNRYQKEVTGISYENVQNPYCLTDGVPYGLKVSFELDVEEEDVINGELFTQDEIVEIDTAYLMLVNVDSGDNKYSDTEFVFKPVQPSGITPEAKYGASSSIDVSSDYGEAAETTYISPETIFSVVHFPTIYKSKDTRFKIFWNITF